MACDDVCENKELEEEQSRYMVVELRDEGGNVKEERCTQRNL